MSNLFVFLFLTFLAFKAVRGLLPVSFFFDNLLFRLSHDTTISELEYSLEQDARLGGLLEKLLQAEGDLLAATFLFIVGESEEEREEEQVGVGVEQRLGELLNQFLENFQQLESAFRIEVAEVLDQVVDVLLDSASFKRVV